LTDGFHGSGSGSKAVASFGEAMSTTRLVALRMLRTDALIRADSGVTANVVPCSCPDTEGQNSTISLASPPTDLAVMLTQMLVRESVGCDGSGRNPWSCDHNGGDALGASFTLGGADEVPSFSYPLPPGERRMCHGRRSLLGGPIWGTVVEVLVDAICCTGVPVAERRPCDILLWRSLDLHLF
jgi:hypothetical protein